MLNSSLFLTTSNYYCSKAVSNDLLNEKKKKNTIRR